MPSFTSSVPSYDSMINPTLRALHTLGGSGSNEEINAKVAELMSLGEDVLEILHGATSGSEVGYRLAWSRTYLKKFGLIENSSRGVWSLTSRGQSAASVDPKEVVAFVRSQRLSVGVTTGSDPGNAPDEAEQAEVPWQDRYLTFLQGLAPSSFERLIQRLLRESGFTHVEVTGRTGDGGIDGIGIARISGFLSFRVLFQCKRYQGSVSPSEIRDFRGAMQGRTDKGLFATTGSFSQKAIAEATRDGAPPIDLLDGQQLVERLKELGLGVRVAMVESVEVDHAWLDSL